MRLIKLAFRMVVAWRASVYAAVAATVAVTAIATLAASIVGPVHLAVTERFRVRFEGELAASLPAPEAERTAREAEATGARVSLSVREPATLDDNGDLLLVSLARVDLPAELAFRGLTSVVEATELASLSPGDAVLLSRSDDGTERPVSRVVTDDEDRLARIVGVAAAGPRGAELLLHDPAVLPGGAAGGAEVHVRVRGTGRQLPRAAGDALSARTALEPTGWNETAREVLAPVSRSVVLLVGILASLAVGTLLPGQLLLVRRAIEPLRLLRAWGFARGPIARLVVLTGAFSAGLAGAVGAGLGLGVAAVLNAQERAAVTLLPAGTAAELAPLLPAGTAAELAPLLPAGTAAELAPLLPAGTAAELAPLLPAGTAAELAPLLAGGAAAGARMAVVTPSVGWALVCAAVATLLGAVTALPSARIAATLDRRSDVWHW